MYINEISEKLNSIMIGCLFHGTLINHLMYADDVVLFCPSAKGLQTLIDCCFSEGNKIDITFNEKKTIYMTITNTFDKSCKCSLPELYLGCKHLNQVDVYKYLGHYVSKNLLDDRNVIRQTQAHYAKGNMLCQNFKDCSNIVKCLLFKSYMYSMYTMNL